MSDLLYQAAENYKKLKDITYQIVLGHKRKSYCMMLSFPEESFYHLAGLHHLKDLKFPSTNKCRIFKEIIKEKITLDMLQKSVFYEKRCIKERISHLSLLEAMLDKDPDIYKINKKAYARYTTIVADYLTERQYSDHETYYLFYAAKNGVNPGSYDECTCCSFFKKHDIDYRHGTFLTSLLILRKYEHCNTPEQKLITEYISPSYHL